MNEYSNKKIIAKIRHDPKRLHDLGISETEAQDLLAQTKYGELADHQVELFRAWDDQLQLDGRSVSTRKCYLQRTAYFLRNINEEKIENIGKEHINAFLAGNDWSDNTVDTYKRAMKQFFKWYYEDHLERRADEVPRFVDKQFKTSSQVETVDKEDIPTTEEVKAFMSAALNYRDRAAIALLADTGMRCKELRYLKRKDVEFDKAGIALMTPTAKRGVDNPRDMMRRVRLTFSRPVVQQWYENHPNKDPDVALICRLKEPYTELTERGLQNMYQRLSKIVDLPADRTDRLSMHKFRHLSITEDRQKQHMRDSFVAKKHGHVDTSMLRRYDHLTADDVDKAQIKAMVDRGELPADALDEIEGDGVNGGSLNLRTCPNCGYGAAPDKALCPRCNQALDAETADAQVRLVTAIRDYIENRGLPEEIAEQIREDAAR